MAASSIPGLVPFGFAVIRITARRNTFILAHSFEISLHVLGSTDSRHMLRQSILTSAMTLGPSSQCPGLWRTLHILTIIVPEAWGSDGDTPYIWETHMQS